MILVTGATGTVGRELMKKLAAAGAPVRALVRDIERAAWLTGPTVELVRGDLRAPETLQRALEGVNKVFLLSTVEPAQVELQGNLIDAAVAAGVQHVVKLSGLGAHDQSPVSCARWHRQTEMKLERALPYTHLQPHYFMQNFFSFAPTIADQGVFYAPMAAGRIPLVDARDVAAVAARALLEDGHAYRTYVLTGPEALSFPQIAHKLSSTLRRVIRYVPISFDEARRTMLAQGLPDWLADALVKLYEIFSADGAADVTSAIADVTGRSPNSFERFVRDHAGAFAQARNYG